MKITVNMHSIGAVILASIPFIIESPVVFTKPLASFKLWPKLCRKRPADGIWVDPS